MVALAAGISFAASVAMNLLLNGIKSALYRRRQRRVIEAATWWYQVGLRALEGRDNEPR